MLDDIEGAAPTAKGLLRVTVDGDQVTVDSPLPFQLVLPDGSTVDGGAPRPVISSRAPRLVLVGSIHAP